MFQHASSSAWSHARVRVESIDTRMLVLLRCGLASAALAILCVSPSRAGELAGPIFGLTLVYWVSSVIVALTSYRSGWPVPGKALHWGDVGFYLCLVSLTGGAHGIFALLAFYPILVASFCWGFREGILVTAVTSMFIAGGEVAGLPMGGEAELGNALVVAGYLFVFGCTISYLGGYERLLRRRLALLREINDQWNPRFGVEHVNSVNLDCLLEFYGGKSCVLILRRPAPSPHYVTYCVTRDRNKQAALSEKISEIVATAILQIPDTLAGYYHDPAGSIWRRIRGFSAYDFDLKARTKTFAEEFALWAHILDAKALVTVPYSQHDSTTGRLFLVSDGIGFGHRDIDFMAQVSNAMAAVVGNTDLVDELIFSAAKEERFSVSRDLHDTTIQPYIGLKIAIEALLRESGEDNPLSWRISELVEMTEMTILDLRSYSATLREKNSMPGSLLIDAVERQAERLRRFFGIRVEVKGEITSRLKGRLAAQAFQIISEGLSNILRHTTAKRAFVSIQCENSLVEMRIGNEMGVGSGQTRKFKPRSISDRVRTLGGEIFVDHRADGYTVVHVKIPYDANDNSE